MYVYIFMAEVFKKKIWVATQPSETKYWTTLSGYITVQSSVSHLNNLNTFVWMFAMRHTLYATLFEGAKQKEDIILDHKVDRIEDQEDGWYSLKWGNEDLNDLGRSWCILLPEYSVSAYVLKTPGRTWKVHVGMSSCKSCIYRCSLKLTPGL